MKRLLVMVLALAFVAGSVLAYPGNVKKGDMPAKGDRNEMNGPREERQEMWTQIYEANKELMDGNREKIRALDLKIEKLGIEFKEEMLKDTPDWKNVEKIMEKSKEYQDKIHAIRQQEQLTILKSLSKEDRAKLGMFFMGKGSDGKRSGHGPGMGR